MLGRRRRCVDVSCLPGIVTVWWQTAKTGEADSVTDAEPAIGTSESQHQPPYVLNNIFVDAIIVEFNIFEAVYNVYKIWFIIFYVRDKF